MTKLSRSVDDFVGEKIRERRVMLGLTQENLAQHLGISYQQVQKYETAANRVSAGRLFEISKVLEAPISFFFDQFDETNIQKISLPHGGTSRGKIELLSNYDGIESKSVQTAVGDLVRSLSSRKEKRGRNRAA